MLKVNGEDREKLKPAEVTSLETLCELTKFNARVTGHTWRQRAFEYYGEKGFWLDSLAERGFVELVCFVRGENERAYEEFGWRVTEYGRRVLIANGGNPNVTHNAFRRRPVRNGSSSQHRF